MATNKYSININNVIPDIVTALNAKGLITLVKYQSGTALVFTTPLTSKVIKITIVISGDTILNAYYGDAWTTGTTITNEVQFGYIFNTASGLLTAVDILADTNFFMLIWQTGTTTPYGIIYVGALESGNELAFGFCTISGLSGNIAMNLTDSVQLYPITFSPTGFKDDSGNILTMPLMWASSTGLLEYDGAAISGTIGVKVSSVISTGVSSVFTGSNYYLTPATLFMSGKQACYTALLIEFTE